MKIERTQEGRVVIVQVGGVIKLGSSAKSFAAYLEGLLDEDVPAVLLDLETIDSVDSTGLGELVGYLQRFAERGKRLALLRPPRKIHNLLHLTRLSEVFPIFESRAQALSELQ